MHDPEKSDSGIVAMKPTNKAERLAAGILERDYHSAFAAFDHALALSPSSAIALCFSAHVRAWAGDYATAVEQAEQSLRLSPFGSLAFVAQLGLAYAHFFAGRCEEAARAAGRATQANPQFSIPWVLRTAALARLGRDEEARASAQRLRELWPGFTIGEFVATKFTGPEHLAMFDEALRLAGLPDG
jgi:tetratricopeptide (TPR) repeat protein